MLLWEVEAGELPTSPSYRIWLVMTVIASSVNLPPIRKEMPFGHTSQNHEEWINSIKENYSSPVHRVLLTPAGFFSFLLTGILNTAGPQSGIKVFVCSLQCLYPWLPLTTGNPPGAISPWACHISRSIAELGKPLKRYLPKEGTTWVLYEMEKCFISFLHYLFLFKFDPFHYCRKTGFAWPRHRI